jgi:hypothetical protein
MDEPTRPVDREALYNEVWTEPVSVVAPRYGLSDVGLAKICRKLAIPLPSRGYWAKVKAGRVMGRALLPKLQQSSKNQTGLTRLPEEEVVVLANAKKTAIRIREEVAQITSMDISTSLSHPLVLATSKRLHRRDGWPTASLVRAAPKEVLHLSVAPSSLERSLSIANTLINAVEKLGFEVNIDSQNGTTLLHWKENDTKVEFSLTEHVRRTRHEITPAEQLARQRYWDRSRLNSSATFPNIPDYDYAPTGVLTMKVGRWPSRAWNDTPRTKLEQRLSEVVAGVVAVAQGTYAREQEQRLREESRLQAIARFEYLTKRRADEIERLTKLETSATNWERATKLRAFAEAVEKQARDTGELSAEQLDWLAWTHAKADGLDPLIPISDPILDAPEPKRTGYW